MNKPSRRGGLPAAGGFHAFFSSAFAGSGTQPVLEYTPVQFNRVGSQTIPCWIAVLALLGLCCAEAGEVSAPPEDEVQRLDLSRHYQKWISIEGFPVVASDRVQDESLLEAVYLIGRMIGHRPDILRAMRKNKVRLAIMATDELTTDIPEHATLKPKVYWDKRARGLGASKERPAVSVGEENLLALDGDPYSTESIMIHEFAHAIHLMGINSIDESFQGRLENAFNRASLKGLWKSKYAGTNPAEYWAEGVQSWFDTNRENDHDHNHVNTREELREHDPALAALVESIFGNPEWRYINPRTRSELLHLSNLNRETAPVFSWPADLTAAYEALQSGKDREQLRLVTKPLAGAAVSQTGGAEVRLRFDNETDETLSILWVDFQGKRKPFATIDPKRNHDQSTYAKHLWLVQDQAGKEIGWLYAPAKDGRVRIR